MAPTIRNLGDAYAVTGQLASNDIAELAALGFRTLINNRPDGEGGSEQPSSGELERAARAAGLHYVHLPVVSGAITPEQAQEMRRVLASVPAPVVAFCRSGARSAKLFELSQNAA